MLGTYYRVTALGESCVSFDSDSFVVLRDELFGDRLIEAPSLIGFRADAHWLADEYVDAGLLERVELCGIDDTSLIFTVTAAHDGLFAVRSGESDLAVVARYSIARSIACYAASASGGYSDVVVCAATPWAAITHNDFVEFI